MTMQAHALKQVTLQDVELRFMNFSGAPGQFNAAGDRNFHLVLTPEQSQILKALGWTEKKWRDKPIVRVKLPSQSAEPQPTILFDDRVITVRFLVGTTNIDEVESLKAKKITLHPLKWSDTYRSGVSFYLTGIQFDSKDLSA